jgi:hypothetical protein
MSQPMTVEQFKSALPLQMRRGVNQELLDQINTTLKDPEHMEMYRDNLLSYTHVLREGKFSMSQYLNAIRYVGFKMCSMSNIDAYVKTFPDKYQDFLARKVPDKFIASYITAYNQSKLVMLIYEQALIPIHLINAPILQSAINVQATLMLTAKSEMVRQQAAACIIKELKPPETREFKLDIAMKEDSTIVALRNSCLELVAEQRKLLQSGMPAQRIAHAPLVIESTLDELE